MLKGDAFAIKQTKIMYTNYDESAAKQQLSAIEIQSVLVAPPQQPWEVKLKNDLLERCRIEVRELEKLGIPPEKLEEFALGYADQQLAFISGKIREFIKKSNESKAAHIKKLELAEKDYIEKSFGLIEVSSARLLWYATATNGITSAELYSSNGSSRKKPVISRVPRVKSSGNPTAIASAESLKMQAKPTGSKALPTGSDTSGRRADEVATEAL